MSAGRKTQTFIVSEKPQNQSTPMAIFTPRNLKQCDLGGVIFGCKNNTMQECFTRELFGLPKSHFSYVKNITPGLPLFLFNYSDKTLHGIFEAATTGQLRIESRAWAGNEAGATQFPAQVKFRLRTKCQPLTETQFRPIIEDNYYEEKHFNFELDRVQTRKLISLFLSFKTTTAGNSSIMKDAEKRKTQLKPSASLSVVSIEGKRGNGFKLTAPAPAPPTAPAPAPTTAPSPAVVRANMDDDKDDSSVYEQSSDLARHMVGGILEDVAKVEHGHAYSVEMASTPPWSALFKKPTPFDTRSKIDAVPETRNLSKMNSSRASLGISEKNWGLSGPQQHNGSTYFTHCAPNNNTKASHSEPSEENAILTSELDQQFDEVNVDCSSEDSNKESYVLETAATEAVMEVATKHIGTNNNHSEEARIAGRGNVMETKSFDIYSIMTKLLGEVNELRLSHQEQEKKIYTLEHAMVKSRLEIQLIKDKCEALKCSLALKSGNQKQEDSESRSDNTHQKLEGSILVVGGHNGSSWLPTTSRYYPFLDCIEPCCPMRTAHPFSSTTMLNGKVYVLGGSLGGSDLVWHDGVEQYDPLSDKWTTSCPFSIKRGSLGAVSFNDKIYAIGGRTSVESFSDVETYVMDIGVWTRAQCMHHKRFSLGAVEIDGAIYAVGGCDAFHYLSSVERFDPRERSWTMLESMHTKRCGLSVVVFNDKLFAVGGFDGRRAVSTVEVFDPRKGRWTPGDHLKHCRADCPSVVIGDSIYTLGGQQGNFLVDKVECYKEGSGWEVTNLKGIGKRWCFSAFVL